MRTKLILARFGLIAFGLAFSLVLMEFALQIGSLFVAGGADAPTRSWATSHRRVLCVGDSNTWGIRLEDRKLESYPARLESLWNSGDRAPAEVLNLGYPGTNSSRLLLLYSEFLEAFAPDLVIVMVGANDYWTAPASIEASAADGGLWGFVSRHSRLYKGYYMLRRLSGTEDLQVEQDPSQPQTLKAYDTVLRFGEYRFNLGWTAASRDYEVVAADLHSNLRALQALSEDASTQLVVMTYPGRWGYYGRANRTIRAFSAESGVPMIDLTRVFRRLCPKSCEGWLYSDQHPTAAGYKEVAATIVEQLPGLMR